MVIVIACMALVMPLIIVQKKRTGTVLPPHKATMYGGLLVGVAVDYSPFGKLVWSTLLHSNLGLSPLSSRGLAAGVVVGIFIVIALYIEAVVQRIRK